MSPLATSRLPPRWSPLSPLRRRPAVLGEPCSAVRRLPPCQRGRESGHRCVCWTGLRPFSSRLCRRRPPPSLPAGRICTWLTPPMHEARADARSGSVVPGVGTGPPLGPHGAQAKWHRLAPGPLVLKAAAFRYVQPCPEDLVTRDIAQPGLANACSRLSGPLLRSAARARRGLFSVDTNRHRTILPKLRTSTPPVSYWYATLRAAPSARARVAWPTGLGPTVGADQRTKRQLRAWAHSER